MKSIGVVALALLAVALAAPAEDSSANASENETQKYDGNISFNLFSESSLKHSLEGLINAVKDTLKVFGLENSIQSEHQGGAKLQGNFNFEGTKSKGDSHNQQ